MMHINISVSAIVPNDLDQQELHINIVISKIISNIIRNITIIIIISTIVLNGSDQQEKVWALKKYTKNKQLYNSIYFKI